MATGLAATVLPNVLCSEPPPGVAVLPLPSKGRIIEALVRTGTEQHPAVAATLGILTTDSPNSPTLF